MITRHIGFALGYATLILLVSLAAVVADWQGWIGTGMPDRIVGVVVGITLAVFANPVAKRLPGSDNSASGSPARASVKRFSALVMVLAGIGYCVVWLVAPVEAAPWVAVGIVLAGFATIAVRCMMGRRPTPRG
jgi:hypothetical protein